MRSPPRKTGSAEGTSRYLNVCQLLACSERIRSLSADLDRATSKLTVYMTTQAPHIIRAAVALVAELPRFTTRQREADVAPARNAEEEQLLRELGYVR